MQWLNLTASERLSARPKALSGVDDKLLAAMGEEIVLTVAGVFREDRSLLELLDADTAFVNERLAKHYGIAGVSGADCARVVCPTANAAALLGIAAVLTVTSYPLRTSPVLRGKWVLETCSARRFRRRRRTPASCRRTTGDAGRPDASRAARAAPRRSPMRLLP